MNFKKLGIVLSGGGGKGAYQIGVWNALREAGLEQHIAAVSGTSVGALNGAMIVQGRYDLAEKMWLKVERHNLLTVEGLPGIAEWLAQKLPPGRLLSSILNSAASKGLFKREGLQAMIADGVDSTLVADAKIPLTVTWHHEYANRVVYHTFRDPAIVANGLLATAALPLIFDQVRIEGELYSDGGFYWELPNRKLDNTPVRSLQEVGCDTVIVICLSQDDLTVSPQQFPGMRVIPIVPRHALGSVMATLDFSNSGAAQRMQQGYSEAKHILRHLDMYLDTGERYQQLWNEVARHASGEVETTARVTGCDARHGDTIDKIAYFDQIVDRDGFDDPLDAAAEDEPEMPSSFELDSNALLSELDRKRINTDVEHFLASCAQDRQMVEESVLDALAALAPVSGRAETMRDAGVISRILGAFSGRTGKLSADNQLALAEGQYATLRLVNAVQRQGALSMEFSCVLQNRLQAAAQEMVRQGERHNEDLQRVYQSMAKVYGKMRDRLMEHEKRIDALERQGRLLSWLSHTNVPRYQGRRLTDLPATERLVTLANEFFHHTEGKWDVDELMSAREMCYRVGLGETTLTAGAFFKDILSDRISANALVDGLVTQPTSATPGGAAGWLLDLRNRRLPGDTEYAITCWNYGADAELGAWNLLVELLYHMRAAGFAPIKYGSEMAALKEQWSVQLGVLDELVTGRLLPAAFRREIAPVRRAIEGFRLKVPLVGKFSTGKSSLINCWLGLETQHIDVGACTAFPVEFHSAATGHEKLVVCWAPVAPEAVAICEQFPDPYMAENRIEAFAQGRRILHIERHCELPALARYPDLVVVDTPGIGSSHIDHEMAVAHYLGDGVLFIFCADRGQIGTDELSFIRRQRQLAQEFSLLVCREDLVNLSERESLQRSLAEQAGLAKDQLVRGCSALHRNLTGFDDLLAHVERSKSALFVRRHRPFVETMLQRAERLIEQAIAAPDDAALRQRKARINRAMVALDASFQSEEQLFIADCAGSVARAVIADVGSFMRARRPVYAARLEVKEDISKLLVADAQNAFELATGRHFATRLAQASRVIEQQVDIGEIGTLEFSADDNETEDLHFSAGLGGMAGAAKAGAGAAAGALLGAAVPVAGVGGSAALMGATVGSVLPGIGTAIGAVLGGVLGSFLLRRGQSVSTESRAAEMIELICSQVEGQAAKLLGAQAREALEKLRTYLKARLDTERENLGRIEELLQEHASKKTDMKQRAEVALAQVRGMLNDPDGEAGGDGSR